MYVCCFFVKVLQSRQFVLQLFEKGNLLFQVIGHGLEGRGLCVFLSLTLHCIFGITESRIDGSIGCVRLFEPVKELLDGFLLEGRNTDIYAINDFCFLATYDNITRYSEFMFGNSAPLEHMMLFPEILEED